MLIEALFECVARFPYILRVVAFFAIQNVDEIGCCASEFVCDVTRWGHGEQISPQRNVQFTARSHNHNNGQEVLCP